MNKTTRTIISYTFVAIFFIATPLMIIYALGYNLNLGWPPKFNRLLQKTGMLIVDSEPAGAKISINGESNFNFLDKFFYSRKGITITPAKIKDIAPGEYLVKFELDNYWPWEKKLQIYPGSSTFAENVILFKKSLPILDYEQKNITQVLVAPKNKIIAIDGNEKTNIYNLNQDSFLFSASTTNKANNIVWSQNGDKIIINSDIYSLVQPYNRITFSNNAKSNIKNTKWGDNSNQVIYYQENDSIIEYDLFLKKNKIIYTVAKKSENYDEKIIDFYIHNDYLFLLKTVSRNTFFTIIDQSKKKAVREISLPNSGKYNLTYAERFLELYDGGQRKLYFIDPEDKNNPLWRTIDNVNKYTWIDNKKILYWNDFEISVFNIDDGQNILLTRISRSIDSVIWHPSDNYILYAAGNTLFILELDERDRRNLIELVKMDQISNITLNDDGDTLYFIGKLNHQSGIYKLAL